MTGTGDVLRSGRVARTAGVNLQTLRYYERRGLIAEPERTLGGHRQYPSETVDLIRAIKTAQRLGFSLDEIAELLPPGGRRTASETGLRDRARDKLAAIEERIADLTAIAETLKAALAAGCDDLATCTHTDGCPLVVPDVRETAR